MATYQTNQKKELIAFLEKNRDKAFTIEEMVDAMSKDPQFSLCTGKSTIYRIIPALVEHNIVKRFHKGTGRKAAYQIMGGESCHRHLHMKCTSCGKLFHMSETDSTLLMKQIFVQNNFQVDFTQTLFYGTCNQCSLEAPEGGVNEK